MRWPVFMIVIYEIYSHSVFLRCDEGKGVDVIVWMYVRAENNTHIEKSSYQTA